MRTLADVMAVVPFALLMAATPIARGHAQVDTSQVDCSEGGSTQYEMNVCAARVAGEITERLDALLTELRPTLEDDEWAALERVQAHWVEFRTMDCQWAIGFFEGGSIQPTLYSMCIGALTEQRIDRLKIMLCEGRGMTGPCEASEKYASPQQSNPR